jgi:pimeloyl-ACP methyl ester carboxylesterase
MSSDFAEKRFVDVGAARICWRQTGSGPALVLLHGFPLSGMTWRNVVSRLSHRFTCYALDLVGLGDSTSRAAADFSSPGQARVLKGALDAEGVSSYVLHGNDTGGWVARELALLDRERVTRLALTNTEMPGHRPPWVPLYQRLVRLPGSEFVIRQMLASRRLRRAPSGFGGCFADLDFMDGEWHDLFIAPLLEEPGRIRGLFRFLEEMRFARIDQFARLHGELTMPVSLLWAENDPTFPARRARAMSQQFPNLAAFRTVRGKLFFYEEQPALVAEWLADFAGGRAGKPISP